MDFTSLSKKNIEETQADIKRLCENKVLGTGDVYSLFSVLYQNCGYTTVEILGIFEHMLTKKMLDNIMSKNYADKLIHRINLVLCDKDYKLMLIENILSKCKFNYSRDHILQVLLYEDFNQLDEETFGHFSDFRRPSRKQIDELTFVNLFDQQDKNLIDEVVIFYREASVLSDVYYGVAERRAGIRCTEHMEIPFDKGTVDLSKMVDECDDWHEERFHIRELFSRLDKQKILLPEILVLDLSANYLRNPSSLQYILQHATELTNLKTIKLNYNHFGTDAWTYLCYLLEKIQTLEFLIITDTMLASVLNRDNFASMPKSYWEKIIWIPKRWLPEGKWRSIVSNECDQKLTYDCHLKYYSQNADQ